MTFIATMCIYMIDNRTNFRIEQAVKRKCLRLDRGCRQAFQHIAGAGIRYGNLNATGIFVGFLNGKIFRKLRKAVSPLNTAAQSGSNGTNGNRFSQICGICPANKAARHLQKNHAGKKHQHKGYRGPRDDLLDI